MKSRLIIISALKIFFIWVVLPFFSFVPVANAQNEARAFCKEKITGYKADPKTGAFLNPDHNAAARCPGGGNICFQINNCIAEYEYANAAKATQKNDDKGKKIENAKYVKAPESNSDKRSVKFNGFIHCDVSNDKLYPQFTVNFESQFKDGVANWQKNVNVARIGGQERLANYKLTVNDNKNFTLESDVELSPGNIVSFRLKGILKNENELELRGNEFYPNNTISRQCDARINFNDPINFQEIKNYTKKQDKNSEVVENSKNGELQKNKEYRIEVISNFIKSNIYYWGNFNCGPHKDTHPAFSNFISDVIVEGKSKIKMNWATGNRQLLLEIKKDGEVSLMGEEQANGFRTYYRLSGNLDIEKNNIKLNGKKTDANNNLDRICDAVINFNNSPSVHVIAKLKNNITEKNSNDINSNQGANVSVVETQIEKFKTIDNSAKEAEIERLAALEIEKKRLKEEAEAKAKAAEANRMAAIEVEKQKQREAAEAKARADKAAKEAEIERLAALEIEKKRLKEEAEAKAKAVEANRLAAIEAEKQKQREAAEAKARADKAAKEAEIERLAALEIEKQKQKEAVAARVAAIEAEKQKQREIAEAKERLDREKEIERLAALEIEKKRIREEKEAVIKAEAIRMAAVEAENKRQKEEAEARARAQRVIELENELKKLKTDSSQSKPLVQQRQENIRTDNDPLTAFEGTWIHVRSATVFIDRVKTS